METQQPKSRPTESPLESWKAIANYLQHEVRTVQRWERDEGLPVHRHEHTKQATVYAYRHEIEAWRAKRAKLGRSGRSRPLTQRLSVAVLAVLGISIVGIVVWFGRTASVSPSLATHQLIVVLPFVDLSEEPLGPMADALTEEIGARLALVAPDGLGVIARTSAMRFKNREATIQEIREQLKVDYAVEGSIRRDGGIVRVTAQLIDTATQARIWTTNIDYPMNGWLDVQQQATADILEQIGGVLGFGVVGSQSSWRPISEAYEHVLLGWHYFDQFGADTLPAAMAHFGAAVEIDSGYVDAQIGLALSHAAQVFFGSAPASQGYREAERWAASALRIDEGNGEATALLGWVEFAYRWNWAAAERAMRTGVATQPSSPWTHWILANYLSALDRPDEAVEMIDAAMRLDPVSPYVLMARGYILHNAGRHAQTIQHWLAVREQLGASKVAGFLIRAYEGAGDYDAAIRVSEELGRAAAVALREGYSKSGEQGYWREIAAGYSHYLTKHPDIFSWRYAVAMSKIGETDAAIEMLERGYHQRAPTMVFLPVYPLEGLYQDPRFQDLLKRMNLPEMTAEVP